LTSDFCARERAFGWRGEGGIVMKTRGMEGWGRGGIFFRDFKKKKLFRDLTNLAPKEKLRIYFPGKIRKKKTHPKKKTSGFCFFFAWGGGRPKGSHQIWKILNRSDQISILVSNRCPRLYKDALSFSFSYIHHSQIWLNLVMDGTTLATSILFYFEKTQNTTQGSCVVMHQCHYFEILLLAKRKI
jgi:hypothetical protein